MRYEMRNENGQTLLTLHEQMTYADGTNFDKLIPALIKDGQQVVIDVTDLSYMDSAGLGMLLSLRDAAQKSQVSVKLCRPQGDVKELVSLASLENLMPIEWQ